MNLAEQLFEPFVFGDPCLHLGEEILGNVRGGGFVADTFTGHMLAVV